MQINQLQQANIPLYNAQVPGEGPRMIPLTLDFTVQDSYQLDGTLLLQLQHISMIQTIWVDASGTDNIVKILVAGSNQQITVKGRTQGYYPVLCPNPFRLTFTCPGGPGAMQVFLLNVPIAPGQWATQ